MRTSAAFLAAVLLALVPGQADAGYSAKTNYILHCQGCHGDDGLGLLAEEVPPLLDSMGWFLHVPGGREYLVQVPGVAYTPVGDAEIAALLNYVLRRFSSDQLPDSFQPYSTEEVASHRGKTADVVALRESLADAIWERLGVRIWTLDHPHIPEPPEVQ